MQNLLFVLHTWPNLADCCSKGKCSPNPQQFIPIWTANQIWSMSNKYRWHTCRVTTMPLATLSKKQDGLLPGCSGRPSSKKTPLLRIQRILLIFKQCVYLGKVSKGPFWKWYAGPSRITNIEQWGSMQKPLHLVRTFRWLVFQLFLILNVVCTHAFTFVFFLFRHFYVQLCVLDNTTLFPVALFLLRVFLFFFFLVWIVFQNYLTRLYNTIHEAE